jgi:Fe2+ or Zn2+ uptake regulation protein
VALLVAHSGGNAVECFSRVGGQMNWRYNRQYVIDLRHNNYFGCEDTGQSEETQDSIEQAWLRAMSRKGWVLGEESIECRYDNDQFTNDADASLVEAHNLVLGGNK